MKFSKAFKQKLIGVILFGIIVTSSFLLQVNPAKAVQFVDEAVLLDEAAISAIIATAFYVGLLAILTLLAAASLALKQYIWTLYTFVVFLGLAYIAFLEQNVTGIFWSSISLTPRELLILGYAMASVNFITAAIATDPNHSLARFKKSLYAMSILLWSTWFFGINLKIADAIILFNLTGAACGIAHFIPFSTFKRLQGGPDNFLKYVISFLLISAILTAVLISADLFETDQYMLIMNRALILLIIICLSFFFIRRIFAVRNDREKVIQKSLNQATEQARINNELLEAERRHVQAKEIARLLNMRLATASHDIQQPISSLRTTVDVLSKNQSAEVREQLTNAFDYLTHLAGTYLEEAKVNLQSNESSNEILISNEEQNQETEPISISLIAGTLDRMFGDEAKDKGLSLNIDTIDGCVIAKPVVLMRILSNLVSNAIKHTESGIIGLSFAFLNEHILIKISNTRNASQNDIGHDEDDFFKPWVKGQESKGQGLGLSIVREQADEHGFDLECYSNEEEGTVFSIKLPFSASQQRI